MDTNLLFTGALPFILIVSAVLTLLVAFFLLWLYRRAVLRGMSVTAGVVNTGPLAPGRPLAPQPTRPALSITTLKPTSSLTTQNRVRRIDGAVTASLRRLALAYTLAGLAYALLFTVAWYVSTRVAVRPLAFLWVWACYTWPVALAISQIIALGWRERIGIVAAYFALLVGIVSLVFFYSPTFDFSGFPAFWLYLNGPATLLLLAFLARRIRAVGPLVLGFITAGVTGAILLSQAVAENDTSLRFFVGGADALGLGAVSVLIFLGALGFGLFGLLIWQLLRRIGHWYQQKRMSDQALLLDTLWLFFAIVQSIALAFEGWGWFFAGAVAFVVYKVVLQLAYTRLVRPVHIEGYNASLLLLRVFALGSRSQELFDALTKRWLRVGPVTLIAGPDLVTALVEPHEFLDFLGGRLSRQFIQSKAHLERRLTELDVQPDPDGRFRVNDLFCRADTWQMTMRQLATSSDSVLMDLRSFSPTNQGCLYELEQLLNGVLLTRIVLVVDATTNQPFLKENLLALWANLAADSPNSRLPAPEIRLFQVDAGTGGEVYALLRLLFSLLPAQLALKTARSIGKTLSLKSLMLRR